MLVYARPVSDRPASRAGASLVLVGVAAVVLCALVVIGADADPLRAPLHKGLTASRALGDVLFVAAAVAAAAGFVILLVSVVMFRPGSTPTVLPRRRRIVVPLLLAVLMAVALRSLLQRSATPADRRPPLAETAPADKEPPPASHVWRDAGWILVAVLGVAALGAAVVLTRNRPRSLDAAPDDSTTSVAVAEAVDAALTTLEAGDDPRQAIIASYAHMLAALEQRGLGCRSHETPRLHVARCLAAADVRREPIERLVQLFEEARFSTHPMTWEDRDEARRALGAVRGDLVGAG
jgi:hypothetical protein